MPKGYDNIAALFQSVLDLPMFEAVGVDAHDIARQQLLNHNSALTGPPAWGQIVPSNLTVLSFNPLTPDFIELSAVNSADLDYTVGDFSVLAWIDVNDLAMDRMVFCRGLLDIDGWEMLIQTDGTITFYTFQAGANQHSDSAAGEVVVNTWYMVGATRQDAAVHIYKNGLEVTAVAGFHVDPAASARKLHIGIDDSELVGGNPWSGCIWRPIILSRFLTADDMRFIFETQRSLFGV